MPRPVTVVTGGSRGIDAATCLRLAADGHDVVVGYVRDADAAESVAEGVRRAGARCATVRGDTAREADVERLFDVAEERLGSVTGLVNNAGVTGPLGRVSKVPPGPRRLARTLAALSERPSTSSTRAILRLATARTRRRG
ncbi:SDR family NAD(P)-dependent oxidoreductase, partial [Streptomyces sp. NPDC026672]